MSTSTITDQFNSNEAMQLLIIHFKHEEYNIGLTQAEIRHLELSMIDDWDNLSIAYRRLLVSKDKLEILSAMSNNETYLL